MANGEANSDWGSNRERDIRSRLPQRQVPRRWPVGSFTNYADTQTTVDSLNDRDEFPVSGLTIVGVDLMQMERVVGRLTWPKVLDDDALYGLWMDSFFGLILGLFQEGRVNPLIIDLGVGAIFGIMLAAVPYAMQNDRRDFSTATEVVARRYDVLRNPHNAKRAHDLLVQRALGGNRG